MLIPVGAPRRSLHARACIMLCALAIITPRTTEAADPTWNDVIYAVAPTSDGTVELMMDIYAATSGEGPHPVVVWIHGGGWQNGSHDGAGGLDLRDAGVTVVSIGYRLSHEAIFPAQIHDCKGAVRFLRANASTFDIDPRRIVAWGPSAGGHLAALLATSGGVEELEGQTGGNAGYSSGVLGGVSYFPLTDILRVQLDCGAQPLGCLFDHDAPSSPESKLIGVSGPGEGIGWLRANINSPFPPFPEKAALARAADPSTHVDAADPPMLIAHGEQDTTVPILQSLKLRNVLLDAGVPVEYHSVAAAGHGDLGAAVSAATTSWILSVLDRCAADYNGAGESGDVLDFLDFFDDFGTCENQSAPCGTFGDPDVNGDTTIDILDFLDFVDAFGAGCP